MNATDLLGPLTLPILVTGALAVALWTAAGLVYLVGGQPRYRRSAS